MSRGRALDTSKEGKVASDDKLYSGHVLSNLDMVAVFATFVDLGVILLGHDSLTQLPLGPSSLS